MTGGSLRKSPRASKADENSGGSKDKEVTKDKPEDNKKELNSEESEKVLIETPRKSSRNAPKTLKGAQFAEEQQQAKNGGNNKKSVVKIPIKQPTTSTSPVKPTINLSNLKIIPSSSINISPLRLNSSAIKISELDPLALSKVTKPTPIVISSAKLIPFSESGLQIKNLSVIKPKIIINTPTKQIKVEPIQTPIITLKTSDKSEESRREGLRGVKLNVNELLGRKTTTKVKSPPQIKQEIFPLEDISFACKICPLVFNSRKELFLHRRVHKKDKGKSNFECSKCHQTFRIDTNFNNHNCDFWCSLCEKSISNKANLKIHLSYVHGIGEAKLFHCDLCGRFYKSKRNIDSHMKIHMLSTPFNCHVCGKGFSHQGALKIHMWNHRDVVECEICQRKFKPRSLYYHIKKCMGYPRYSQKQQPRKVQHTFVQYVNEEDEEEQVQEEMVEEYIEEYEEGGETMEWNYGVEVIKNEKI